MKEVKSIQWTRGAIKHITKHNIEPFEVEEALFEDKPIIRRGGKDRAYILAQTLSGRSVYRYFLSTCKGRDKYNNSP